MIYPPTPSEQVILKTAHAALRGYAAAFTSHFQTLQADPACAETTSASLQPPARATSRIRHDSALSRLTDFQTRSLTAPPGSFTCNHRVREAIRLTDRPSKNLLKQACRIEPLFDVPARSKRMPHAEMSDLRGRQLTDHSTAESSSLRGKSVPPAIAEEYCIRRVTRQRVFHEKGNAD